MTHHSTLSRSIGGGPGVPSPLLEEALEHGKSERLAALVDLAILDTPTETGFDEIALLAAEVCHAGMAAISLVEEHRQWFKAAINLPARETPICQSFCAHVVVQNGPLIVEDATEAAAFSDNPLVTGQLGIRFYAGIPIHAPSGVPIGALCVIDRAVRPGGLTEIQRRALVTLARQVERLLEMRIMLSQRDRHVAAQRALTSELTKALRQDFLTGLPNRSAFQEALTAAIGRQELEGGRVALMLLDLDHFKQINDWLGHDAGDEVLKDFSAKLRKVMRGDDIVARLGGDEFGMILRITDDDNELAAAVKSITARLLEPVYYHGRTVAYRQSVGIALHPDHASSAVDLIRHCDLALIEAKSLRGSVVVFDPGMATKHSSHMELLEEANNALNEQRILAYYQPKVDFRSGRIVGFEALARCKRPEMQAEHPRMFEALFQDAALSRWTTEQITERILTDIRRWNAEGLEFGHVAINASCHDFSDDNFGERLLRKLKDNDVDPSDIQIEVTENVLLGRGQKHVYRALELLNEAGIKIALDDFGTGHASLVHLKRFPVHYLKIDRSFLMRITENLDDAVIVRAIIGLGHSLGMEIIAEGVETMEQLRMVSIEGCNIGQGYLFSRAVTGEEVGLLMQRAIPAAGQGDTNNFTALCNEVAA